MAMIDPNEIFAWLRVCPDRALVAEVQQKAKERLDQMQTSRMGPAAQAERRGAVHVQPTDETRPGGEQAQPLTGPNPGWSGGGNVFALAQEAQRREAAQKNSLRGPGPEPVTVQIGPVPEDAKKESEEIRQDTARAVLDATRQARPVNPPAGQQPAPQPLPPMAPAGAAQTAAAASVARPGGQTAQQPASAPQPAVGQNQGRGGQQAPVGQTGQQSTSERPASGAQHGTAAASSAGEGQAAKAAAQATSQQRASRPVGSGKK